MPFITDKTRMSASSEDIASILKGGNKFFVSQGSRVGSYTGSFLDSVSFAWEGIMYAARTQRNFRIHLAFAAIAITTAMVLEISIMEWALLWGVIGMVMFAEMMNTVVELLVDMMTEGRFDLRAKAIKDMAAGAVFITALAALAIGMCIFTPHIFQLLPL